MTDAQWVSGRWLSQMGKALDGFRVTVQQMVTGAALIECSGCECLSLPPVELGAPKVSL